MLTDPAIHTRNNDYFQIEDGGNLRKDGINAFFDSKGQHPKCN